MATRIVEPLQINADRQTVLNWIKRLTAGIELVLFDKDSKLPNDPTEKAQMVEKVKKNFLISNIGGQGLTELSSLCAPDDPDTKTFEVLIKLLTDHYAPNPNKISEEYKFNKIAQESGESLASYFTRVKIAAQLCDFGTKFDQMIRNRFICGMRDSKIRDELLNSKDDSTANQIYELARTKEAAHSAGSSMGGHQSVNFVRTNTNRGGGKSPGQKRNRYTGAKTNSTIVCERCTLRGHTKDNCVVKCRGCKKVGHIQKNCRSTPRKPRNPQHVRHTEVEDSQFDDESDHATGGDVSHEHLFSVNVSQCDAYFVSEPACTPTDPATSASSPSTTPSSPGTTPSVAEPESLYTDPVPSDTNCSVSIESVDSVTESGELEICINDNNCDIKIVDFTLNSLHNETSLDLLKCNNSPIAGNRTKPMLNILMNGKYVPMEVDTGAAVSCISSNVFDRLSLSGCVLSACNVTLCVANGQTVKSHKRAAVSVKFKTVTRVLPLYIVDSAFPTLLGLEWIRSLFGNDWFQRLTDLSCSVNQVQSRKTLIDEIKTSRIFDSGMGLITGYQANIDLKPNAKPVFCKFRQPPFAHMEAIGRKIDQLESEGILVKVDSSDYASPVMPVIKPDGDVRLCGDYKRTLNPNIDTAVYPLPVIEDCLWSIRGGELFSKLDIKGAYNHVPVRKEDQPLLTINTHKGLYKFTRLPFGVSSASAIFQSIMDQVLTGIPGVACRVDDIIITGKDDTEHMRNLREVVNRLEKSGFRCRADKCEYMQPEVVYLGHRITKHGCSPVRSKVETIAKAPYPKSREELISFLGMIQYYARYLPDLHSVIEPLNRLRSKSVPWQFDESEKSAFNKLKNLISSDRVLTFYDPDLPLRLDTDASAVGIGAVLSHVINGVDRPIEFVSRTLKPAERNYSQIEREALAIVWAIRRFHRFLFARVFILCTDHKPLEMIFDPYKSLSEVVSNRIQRWGMFLTSYRYTVEFRPTGKHANADMCSRFPLACEEEPELEDIGEMFSVDADFSVLSVTLGEDKPLLNCKLIAKETRVDPVLSKVIHYVLEGWTERMEQKPLIDQASSAPCGTGDRPMLKKCPRRIEQKPPTNQASSAPCRNGDRPVLKNSAERIEQKPRDQASIAPCGKGDRPLLQNSERPSSPEDPEMRTFRLKQHELSVDSGCLMWGSRVVIPAKMRECILEMLHSTHMGVSSMKSLARGYVWWPGLDMEIERVAKKCEACSLSQRLPNRSVPHPWVAPSGPWERIHIDYAGAFMGYMWLLIVDAYSKWLEVCRMSIGATKSKDTIKALREVFCRNGLPQVIVSDNGPQFVSDEMATFMRKNGIHHVPTPTYHPASNGQAESLVGKFKSAMKKMRYSNPDITLNLQNWLMSYRNTPHSTTGVEPAVLMMGRRARTALSLIHPLHQGKSKSQLTSELSRETCRKFEAGAKVLYWDMLKHTWIPGVVSELQGSKVLKIVSQNGTVRKHIDHVVGNNTETEVQVPQSPRKSLEQIESGKSDEAITVESRSDLNLSLNVPVQKPSLNPVPVNMEPSSNVPSSNAPVNTEPNYSETNNPVARPKRITKQPNRLQYDKLGGN